MENQNKKVENAEVKEENTVNTEAETISDAETKEAEKKGVIDQEDVKKVDQPAKEEKEKSFKTKVFKTAKEVAKVTIPAIFGSALTLGILYFMGKKNKVTETILDKSIQQIPAVPQIAEQTIQQIPQMDSINDAVENLAETVVNNMPMTDSVNEAI